MRIVYEDDEWYVRGRDDRMLFREFVKQRRIESGLKASTAQSLAGIGHPGYLYFENGTTKSPLVGLKVLDALGVDLFIFPTAEAGDAE